MKTFCSIQSRLQVLSTAIATLLLMSVIMANTSALHAQTTSQASAETTIEGVLYMYLVSDYGESLQKVDQYCKTGEDAYVAFVLMTDDRIDMVQCLDKEDVEALEKYCGKTKQSVFMLVPNSDLFETFSGKAFAAQYANKRLRVTGTFYFPMGGWHYITPVAMEYSKVELAEPSDGNAIGIMTDTVNPTKYFLALEDDPLERQAYARELTIFAEKLQHDRTTFDANLSAKLGELGISLLTSPDGKLKVYSWHDGDIGSAISFHTVYQTKQNGEFHSVFMEDYYREPRKIYQVESSAGPVYLVEYYFRVASRTYNMGVDAFTIDKTGLLQPANIFECIPELCDTTVGFLADLSVWCDCGSISSYYKGGWQNDFFFELTGKDIYMPHLIRQKESNWTMSISDFYHRFEWDGNKFRYKQLEFNPKLAKILPEPGWLMEEFEWGDSLVRIDSVADGSYRYIVWKKDNVFSSAPELIITQGQYDAGKHEYRFNRGDEKYVVDAVLQEMLYVHAQQIERLSKSEIEANETPQAVAYNFAMSIINKDYPKMFELATPEYKTIVQEDMKEFEAATVEQFFSDETFDADIVGMRHVMEKGGYEVAVEDVYETDISLFFQDGANPFEGLPSICVKLLCVDADNNPYVRAKGDYDSNASVYLVKKDGVWRVLTFK